MEKNVWCQSNASVGVSFFQRIGYSILSHGVTLTIKPVSTLFIG
uniref:Uncharacterized protein n=1 Tax=Anguilla anguilla TaxID=7936 RepID=A0A0E9U1S6_ANGAN